MPADSPVSKFRSPVRNPERYGELTTTSDSTRKTSCATVHGTIVTKANFRAQLCTALHIGRPCDRICMEEARHLRKKAQRNSVLWPARRRSRTSQSWQSKRPLAGNWLRFTVQVISWAKKHWARFKIHKHKDQEFLCLDSEVSNQFWKILKRCQITCRLG